MPKAVELRQVTKRFGNHGAVDHLDLIVPEGTVYGFIGPNGSGKTTTLRMILRIFYPDEGRVSVLGRDQWVGAVVVYRNEGNLASTLPPDGTGLSVEGTTVSYRGTFVGPDGEEVDGTVEATC